MSLKEKIAKLMKNDVFLDIITFVPCVIVGFAVIIVASALYN